MEVFSPPLPFSLAFLPFLASPPKSSPSSINCYKRVNVRTSEGKLLSLICHQDWNQKHCVEYQERGLPGHLKSMERSKDKHFSEAEDAATPYAITRMTQIYRHNGGASCFQMVKNGNFFKLLRKVAFIIGILDLAISPEAWSGTEAATVPSISLLGDIGDLKSGFASAFLLIFFSEIGDKTFFIAALLASRKTNSAVFMGTFGALVAMSIVSVFLGRTVHYIDGILPFSIGDKELPFDDLAAVILLVYFGVITLIEARSLEGSKAKDEQQEAELAIAGVDGHGTGFQAVTSTIVATFVLVFVAEWGDKSFFSTIALAAASSPLGVIIGAVAAHGAATSVAVLGGSFLSTYISEKAIAYIGGILFIAFAIITLFEIFW